MSEDREKSWFEKYIDPHIGKAFIVCAAAIIAHEVRLGVLESKLDGRDPPSEREWAAFEARIARIEAKVDSLIDRGSPRQ